MSEDAEPVERFLSAVDTVYGEYDQGYMDADVALARIRDHVEDLEAATEE
jgi:hypothetical protein